ARDRKSDDDHRRGPGVEARAVGNRLAHTERNRDEVGEYRQPKPERDRDRELFLDQLNHADIAEIALAEIEAGVVPHHQQEGIWRGLVEAELLFQILDQFGIEALR